MSNVREISLHPRFRPKLTPAEDNPIRERQEYLRYLDEQGQAPTEAPAEADPFDALESILEAQDFAKPVPMTEAKFKGGSIWFGLSVCAHCEHRRDFRPWYRRLLSRPKLTDLFCAVSPREKVLEPITGIEGYLPYGTKIPANAQPEPFDSCLTRNCLGTCPQFKPTLTY